MRAALVVFAVLIAGAFTVGLLGIAGQVAERVPCPVPAATGTCP